MTAIWARFAASATRVKSRRKASVEGGCWPLGWGGAIIWFVDMCDDEEEMEDVESWRLGDWIGAFMVGGVWLVMVTIFEMMLWSCQDSLNGERRLEYPGVG